MCIVCLISAAVESRDIDSLSWFISTLFTEQGNHGQENCGTVQSCHTAHSFCSLSGKGGYRKKFSCVYIPKKGVSTRRNSCNACVLFFEVPPPLPVERHCMLESVVSVFRFLVLPDALARCSPCLYANNIFSSSSSTSFVFPPEVVRPKSPFLALRSMTASARLLYFALRATRTSRLTWLGETNSLFS